MDDEGYVCSFIVLPQLDYVTLNTSNILKVLFAPPLHDVTNAKFGTGRACAIVFAPSIYYECRGHTKTSE